MRVTVAIYLFAIIETPQSMTYRCRIISEYHINNLKYTTMQESNFYPTIVRYDLFVCDEMQFAFTRPGPVSQYIYT